MATCCNKESGVLKAGEGVKRVALVGNPNVGKSVLFNALTGAYVTVPAPNSPTNL